MKRIGLIPIILLGISLLVLVVMISLRTLDNRNQRLSQDQTNTAVMKVMEVRQTEDARPTATPLPSKTPTLEPSATIPFTTDTPWPTPTGEELELVEGCDVAAFITDVSIPDGTIIDADTKFVKTWRILNDGNCTWNSYYKFYFHSGIKMSGPTSKQLVAFPVPPGSSIDISVELRAPKESGTYKGYWGLKNTNGVKFGMGPLNKPFYVEIIVP